MSDQHFRYYTSQNFVIKPEVWNELSGKVDGIRNLAEDTVIKQQKLREKSSFTSNAAYQVYLFYVNMYAWAEKLGAVVDTNVTEY